MNSPQIETAARNNDDVVLWIVIAVCLTTPIGLCALWAIQGIFFPPMLISVLLGTAIAALTYRYLGGTIGSEFSVGVLKVAGSAGLLLGMVYLTNDGLSKQMDAENSANLLKGVREERDSLELKNKQLSEALEHATNNWIPSIEKLTPDTPQGRAILDLARSEKGPWARIVEKIDVPVAVGRYIKNTGQFAACADMNLTSKTIRFVRTVGQMDDLDIRSVTATFAGQIESTICDRPNRKFSVHLSCQAALELFPDHLQSCTTNGAKWLEKNGERYFTVRAEVMPQQFTTATLYPSY
jgi:hypothetical protein